MADGYRSVLEMAQDNLSADYVGRLKGYLNERAVSSALCVFRCSKGLTQKQLAKKIGATEDQIALFEDSADDEINIAYLNEFANAFDMKVTILFDSKDTDARETIAVNAIKSHVFQTQRNLNALANLVDGDETIHEGVDSFYQEYLFNILQLFLKSFDKLRGQNTDERDLEEIAKLIQKITMDMVDESENVADFEEPFVVQPQELKVSATRV